MLSMTSYHTEETLSSMDIDQQHLIDYFHGMGGDDYTELGRYILGVEDVVDDNALRIMVELYEEHKPEKFVSSLREFIFDNYEEDFEDWMVGNAIGNEEYDD